MYSEIEEQLKAKGAKVFLFNLTTQPARREKNMLRG